MIPSTIGFLEQDFEVVEQPSFTFKMNHTENAVRGYTDEIEAMKQAIFKILQTERYQYQIYSGNYGIELIDLFGKPISYVCPELERRISEALLWDNRITSVNNFNFTTPKKGELLVTFNVQTIFGEIEAERTVNF